jgi:hypothetical protein
MAMWQRASAFGSGLVLEFLHQRPDFDQLLLAIADARGLDPHVLNVFDGESDLLPEIG